MGTATQVLSPTRMLSDVMSDVLSDGMGATGCLLSEGTDAKALISFACWLRSLSPSLLGSHAAF